MLKVMTIVGTRPELIKMCRVIPLFDAHTDHYLVHTGQNYDFELNQVFFDELRIRRPDHFLDVGRGSAAETIARVIERADKVICEAKPDALLIYGDTNSGLAVIAAKRRRIPIFHMEAGNRCFDHRVPEELNRKLIDHLSDINIVITEHARRNLLAENLPADRIFKLGSHLPEIFDHFREEILQSSILTKLDVVAGKYFVASAHREENVDSEERLALLLDSLNAVASEWRLPIIFSAHPRTRQRLAALGHVPLDPLIRLVTPLGFFDYITLQTHARCVLSDSGSLTEEAAILGFPAVTLRDSHERPEGMDEGVLIMCGLRRSSVLAAVRVTLSRFIHQSQYPRDVEAYRSREVSQNLLALVHSYVPYVRERIWHHSS